MDSAYRLLTIAVLVVLILESHRGMKTWANPVVFYAGPFAVVLALQQILIPHVPFGGRVAAFIAGSAMAFFVGAVIVWRPREVTAGPRPQPRRFVARDARSLKFGIVASFVISLYYLYVLWQIRGSGANVVNGVFYREAFYAAGGQTLTMRLLQALTYASVFFIAFAAATVRRPTLLLAPMVLIMLAQSSAASSKLPTLLALEVILVVSSTIRPEAFRRLRPRLVVGAFVGIAVTLLVFGLVTSDRSQGTGNLVATTEYTLLGSPSALSELLDGRQAVTEQYGFGASFGGIVSALGGEERLMGMYTANVQLAAGVSESRINIYTWLVPLRHDFGIFGCLGLIGLLGAVLTSLFARARDRKLGVASLGVLALGNLTLTYAPITILTYYNVWFLLLALALSLSLVFQLAEDEQAAIEAQPTRAEEGNAGPRPQRS